jgi:hypothetical protein
MKIRITVGNYPHSEKSKALMDKASDDSESVVGSFYLQKTSKEKHMDIVPVNHEWMAE